MKGCKQSVKMSLVLPNFGKVVLASILFLLTPCCNRKLASHQTTSNSNGDSVDEPAVTPEQNSSHPKLNAKEEKYIVGPFLSREAKEAGVYYLSHEPYSWPSDKDGPRLKKDPQVIPLDVPTTLKRGKAKRNEKEFCRLSNFVELQLKTATGWIDLAGNRGGFDEWVTFDKKGNTVLTPPKEWDGVVLDVWRCGKKGSSSILAFGERGLINYREYMSRYLTWRSKDMTPHWQPDNVEIASSELSFVGLITGDINADNVPELIAYTVILWKDEYGEPLFSTEEVGIIWQNTDAPPTLLTGMSPMPNVFNILKVVPPSLNDGRPIVFATEYCCGGTGYRMKELNDREFSKIRAEAADGDWNVYLIATQKHTANLQIAENEKVVWEEK